MTHRTILIATLLTACAFAQAQQQNFTWNAGQNGTWEQNSNWSPEVPNGEIIGGTNTASTIFDRVTIAGNYTVTRTGDIFFRTAGDLGVNDPRFGTFNALTLSGGATLNVSGTLWVTTSGGAVSGQRFVRNVLIGTGSTLVVGEILTGTQNNVNARSTWRIEGTVNATTFKGMQGSATNTNAGRGYILNVDGGSLNVSGNFIWSDNANPANTARRGEINISNGGMVVVGTMSQDWLSTTGNYVNFVDGSGSLKFGNAGWDLAAVQGLISGNYIRSDVEGLNLQITNVGDAWVVAAIPEASTTISMVSVVAVAAAFGCRRRRSRD